MFFPFIAHLCCQSCLVLLSHWLRGNEAATTQTEKHKQETSFVFLFSFFACADILSSKVAFLLSTWSSDAVILWVHGHHQRFYSLQSCLTYLWQTSYFSQNICSPSCSEMWLLHDFECSLVRLSFYLEKSIARCSDLLKDCGGKSFEPLRLMFGLTPKCQALIISRCIQEVWLIQIIAFSFVFTAPFLGDSEISFQQASSETATVSLAAEEKHQSG